MGRDPTRRTRLPPFLKEGWGAFFRTNTREEALEQLITFCQKGPPGAKVLDVEVHWREHLGEFDDFEIRYWG
ncbi:hypothetical protein DRP53_05560 [candidate division WOR-3 bacterium]|uniref:Acylphosphatase-like domain-containing protein n=1 Tax=candidate division WOR-3 bacterium TaxID=2052148 RepID=A0A660SJL5_UNCW3|nr:MAG: hypothetical protein DRP53_05560 [candidate division WOR-3 bacterium]